MKALFKKPWFVGLVSLGLLIITFFLNLWILSIDLSFPYGDDFWALASDLSTGEIVNIFALIFTILFYLSIVPILLSGLSIIKKNNKGFVVSVIYFIVFSTFLIIFQSIYQVLSAGAIVLIVFSILFDLSAMVLLIFRSKGLHLTVDPKKIEKERKLTLSRLPLAILIVNIVTIIVLMITFLIPVYSLIDQSSTYYAVLINVLLFGETKIEVVIYFLINFVLFLSTIIYLAQSVSYYFYDKESFIRKSKTLITYVFVITLVFFLCGLSMVIYQTLIGNTAETIAYIPMVLMSIVIFAFSIFMGKFHALNQTVNESKKAKFARVESLFYLVLLSAITASLLLLRVIKIVVVSGSFEEIVNLTGLAIIRDYPNLDPGYRMIAFILVVMLISSALFLIASIAGYLSKYKHFDSIVKSTTAVNIFFIFIISISGYYFQIGREINHAVILSILDYYGINLPSSLTDYTYTIKTDAVYALIAAVSLLVIMFIRKAFERDELNLFEMTVESNNTGSSDNSSVQSITDENLTMFDPCPAFTELDLRHNEFREEQKRRESLKTKSTTLNELINFIVEYARNSRLHLSYTEEDIATFVAGLGASKLSILQGMSGTGKTSLPKIFAEAILGNCEIIEVESSWKDKNELLGYYNEFSMKYTPKKFTLALYKSALNQEVFTFILLDEMNLSRIEYYFSDFLSLMENEENQRELKLINIKLSRHEGEEETDYLALSHGHTLRIPPNIWFIGTANRDESTFVISDKVYDRAQTMNFTKRAKKVRNYSNPIPQQYYNYQTINQLFTEAKKNGTFDAENSELIKAVEILLAPFNISFGNRILKQIEDFVNIYKACFANEDVENEAVEKILLSKVVAKLEVKTIDDKEKLVMDFEKLGLHQCVNFINHLDSD